MVFKIFNRKVKNVNALFMGHYIDVKVFYVTHFNEIPCISFIGDLDTSKAFDYVSNRFKYQFTGVYQHNYFDHDKQDLFFNNTLYVLNNKRMIEVGSNFCHVLHSNRQYDFGLELVKELAAFRVAPAGAEKVIGFARNNHVN